MFASSPFFLPSPIHMPTTTTVTSSVSDNDSRDIRCSNNTSTSLASKSSSQNLTNPLSGLEHLLPPGGLNGAGGASLAAAAMAASGGGGDPKLREFLSYIYQCISRQKQSAGEHKVS